MKAAAFRRFLSFFLAVILLYSGCPGMASELTEETGPAAEASEATPTESIPEQTIPEETIPGETTPEETIPGETTPEETTPEETTPEENMPEEAVPTETPPAETLPEAAAPTEAQPEESAAEETESAQTLPQETEAESLLSVSQPEPAMAAPEASGPGLYFGLLHAHTSLSSGAASADAVFSQAAQVPGLDFFAVTDHSHSFDNRVQGSIDRDGSTISEKWATGKAAAAAATTGSFVGIYGYEMSWPARMQVGHIATFGTPGFQSWDQEPFSKYKTALKNYYAALASASASVSQFNHPGTRYGTFQDFAYSEAADGAVSLIELGTGKDACRYYIKALDLGWHLAPVNSQADAAVGSGRTVVYAQSLTEADILSALGQCRAYATEDDDLEIFYTMNGHIMGSRLKKRHIGDSVEISVSLKDPTDASIGVVEIITNGGETVASRTISQAEGTVEFSLPPKSGYYFLKITQPDGNTAVTAPVWLDAEEHLGITALTCETAVPVQKEEVTLKLELFNRETVDFRVTALEVLEGETVIHRDTGLTAISAESNSSFLLTFAADCVGLTDLEVRLTGTLEGSQRCYTAKLRLNFRRSELVTAVFLDGAHGNAGLDLLTRLKEVAMDRDIRLSIGELSPEGMESCRLLVVTAPGQPLSEEFLGLAAEFAGYGGSILICGQAQTLDEETESAAQLNRLLETLGSTLRLRADLVEDPVTNSGDSRVLFPDGIQRDDGWCAGVSENQVWRLSHGCSVDPGSGTPLVWGRSTTRSSDAEPGTVTLLACEPLSGGGTVFVSGSLFCDDDSLEQPKNIWDEPYANDAVTRNLLGIGGPVLALSTIAQARAAAPGTPVRIRGYATTGTSNANNRFPDMLYLQDDTGGIAVTPFDGEGIQAGTPLEVTGFAGASGENRTLKTGSWTVLEGDLYQYAPLTGSWTALLSTAENGQRLIQVEGTCVEIYCREDDTLAGCLLKDDSGATLRVKIEDGIRNGSDGENTLQKMIRKNRVVRAIGLLHVDEYGETVLRVRNCEEVVWVPPKNYVNPKTGDQSLPFSLAVLTASCCLLWRRRRRVGRS